MQKPSTPEAVQAALARLDVSKGVWATRSVTQKRADLAMLLQNTAEAANDWVKAATAAKGIAGSPSEGEEWLSGPWAMELQLKATMSTLERYERGEPIIDPETVHLRPNGQLMIDVYPLTWSQHLIMNRTTAQVWMQPGVTRENLEEHTAVAFRQPNREGGIALVLGAGNIASIPPLDSLYELIAENRVVLCKMNPVNDYLGPIFERIFAPMIAQGFISFCYGGADVGQLALNDKRISKVHITGSAQSHDAIVYGTGEEGARRKANKTPKLTVPITSELGGVGATIIVPGPWSDADLRFQAEQVASQKIYNGGFNCIAAQVLVLHEQWPLKEKFLATLRDVIAGLPPRPAYYPGAKERQCAAIEHHLNAETLGGGEVPRTRLKDVNPNGEDWVFQTEFFGSVWAETSLSAPDAASFLRDAVKFANEKLMGTLGTQVIIHPDTEADLGSAFDRAIADLRYGTIGINTWCGVGFVLPTLAWGAYPGHPLEDIQSGRGVVHNALLLEKTEKNVVRAPFSPFPRAWMSGDFHISPKPPWFVTHARGAEVGRLLTAYEASSNVALLPQIIIAALQG